MEFIEIQQLKLWWLYILLGIDTIIVGSIVLFDKGGMSWQDLKDIYFLPVFAIALPYIVVYFVTNNVLTLSIDQCGINYKYWPFSKNKTVSWTRIEKMYIRKYDAFGEYGGWGLRNRLWFKFNDKAYVFNDNNLGLQLELNNNKRLLFSTSKTEELSLFLINLKTKYNIGAIETDVRER
ncbi:hypothetical protein EZ428_08585 [Pedobacter frigiditerrae]|uniref:Uncharacterized protein n=1 Tax=Pedobacter frigiditerrae TaxID=2530452 RepID=A0A4R0MX40_9SPHI|nr:hypothetical protein [Pedobacter frigiditerrae]TCC91795.1 hypothetical protein EZ428_08585 [Pedobacter frigiditerrae]